MGVFETKFLQKMIGSTIFGRFFKVDIKICPKTSRKLHILPLNPLYTRVFAVGTYADFFFDVQGFFWYQVHLTEPRRTWLKSRFCVQNMCFFGQIWFFPSFHPTLKVRSGTSELDYIACVTISFLVRYLVTYVPMENLIHSFEISTLCPYTLSLCKPGFYEPNL